MQKRKNGLVGAQTTAAALIIKLRECVEIAQQLEKESASDLSNYISSFRVSIHQIGDKFEL